jgi:hypothetical protein
VKWLCSMKGAVKRRLLPTRPSESFFDSQPPTVPAGVTKPRLGLTTDCDHAPSTVCHYPSL